MTNVSLLKQPQRSFELKRKLLVKKTKNIQSKGRLAANSNDADYLLGCGVGGYDNENGNDGLVVIVDSGLSPKKLIRRKFYFNEGKIQTYSVVGIKPSSKMEHRID